MIEDAPATPICGRGAPPSLSTRGKQSWLIPGKYTLE